MVKTTVAETVVETTGMMLAVTGPTAVAMLQLPAWRRARGATLAQRQEAEMLRCSRRPNVETGPRRLRWLQ